jgi:hypothetical protein
MNKFENVFVVASHGKVEMADRNLFMEPVLKREEADYWINQFIPSDEYVLAHVDTLIEVENEEPKLRRAYVLYINFKKNSLFNPGPKGRLERKYLGSVVVRPSPLGAPLPLSGLRKIRI